MATVSPLCSTWLLVILYNVSLRTLASGVLLMQESSVSIIARFLHVGRHLQRNFQESTCTEILYLHGTVVRALASHQCVPGSIIIMVIVIIISILILTELVVLHHYSG